jgi:hypothetical protein
MLKTEFRIMATIYDVPIKRFTIIWSFLLQVVESIGSRCDGLLSIKVKRGNIPVLNYAPRHEDLREMEV